MSAELFSTFAALQRKPEKVTTQETYDGAKARVWENRVMVKWVGQALRYRIIAYKKALKGLEIETPSRDRVWKVNKTLYGVKQAAQEWHKALVHLLGELGFRCINADAGLYIRKDGKCFIFIWVDDLFVICTSA